MTKQKELSPKVQTALDKVMQQFKDGDLTPLTKTALLRMPDSLPSAKWSFANTALAYMTTGLNADCRGFKQWKEVGRTVKKGSSCGYIFRPKTFKTDREDDNGDPVFMLTGFQPIPVFGLGQTEGDELPADQLPVQKQPPSLAGVAQKLGVKVAYDWYPNNHAAGTFVRRAGGAEIKLFTEDEATWWHELAHAAHHSIDDEFDERSKGEKEAIAEFTSAVIAQLYGRPKTGDAYSYINDHYKDPVKGVMKSLAMIEKVLEVMEL